MEGVAQSIDRAPWTFWAYVASTAIIAALAQLPSSMRTTFTWWGVVVELLLLVGLFMGSNVARWILLVIGVLAAFAGVSVQTTPLDAVPTGVSVFTLAVTCLLLTPSMRVHTAHRPSI